MLHPPWGNKDFRICYQYTIKNSLGFWQNNIGRAHSPREMQTGEIIH